MNVRSAKAKGKRLENLVVNRIKEAFNLGPDDIRVNIGAENGADVKLSAKAKARFPFSVECKARNSFTTLYGFYDQARSHYPELVPLVVLKEDRKEPLVLLNFDMFLTLINNKKEK